jgi:hypothetical protein
MNIINYELKAIFHKSEDTTFMAEQGNHFMSLRGTLKGGSHKKNRLDKSIRGMKSNFQVSVILRGIL